MLYLLLLLELLLYMIILMLLALLFLLLVEENLMALAPLQVVQENSALCCCYYEFVYAKIQLQHITCTMKQSGYFKGKTDTQYLMYKIIFHFAISIPSFQSPSKLVRTFKSFRLSLRMSSLCNSSTPCFPPLSPPPPPPPPPVTCHLPPFPPLYSSSSFAKM